MKIGIVTLYDAYNCGSFLQAYALQKFIEKQGEKPVVLDCSSDRLRWLKRIVALSPRRLAIKLRKRYAYGKAWKKLNIKKYRSSEIWDVTFFGSDEIWNIANPHFEHCPQYFGELINSKKKVAYAPSIGYADVDGCVDDEHLVSCISEFDSCYVRDDSTKRLVECIRKEKVKRVCDPTLLLYDEWQNYEEEYKIEEPYMIIYGYSNESCDIKDEIQNYAKKKGLKIISVAFDCSWADDVVIPTPFQFLNLVHNASCVFGTTFHISVFATIYNKPFCVKSSMQKTLDFLELTGQTERLYIEDGDFEKVITKNICNDYTAVSAIKQLINDSREIIISELK